MHWKKVPHHRRRRRRARDRASISQPDVLIRIFPAHLAAMSCRSCAARCSEMRLRGDSGGHSETTALDRRPWHMTWFSRLWVYRGHCHLLDICFPVRAHGPSYGDTFLLQPFTQNLIEFLRNFQLRRMATLIQQPIRNILRIQ